LTACSHTNGLRRQSVYVEETIFFNLLEASDRVATGALSLDTSVVS
jgi:hypothetical protein